MSTESILDQLDTCEKLVLAGVILVLVSGFFPLITAEEEVIPVDVDNEGPYPDIETDDELLGTESSDWWLMAIPSALAGLFVWRRNWDKITLGAAGISAALVVLISLLYINDPLYGISEPFKSELESFVSVGIGLYIALIGGVLQSLGAYQGYLSKYSRSQDTPSGSAGSSPHPQLHRQTRGGRHSHGGINQPGTSRGINQQQTHHHRRHTNQRQVRGANRTNRSRSEKE